MAQGADPAGTSSLFLSMVILLIVIAVILLALLIAERRRSRDAQAGITRFTDPQGLGTAFIVLGILSIVPAIGRYLPTGLGAPARGLALGQAGVDVIGPVIAAAALVFGLVTVAWLAFRRQEL